MKLSVCKGIAHDLAHHLNWELTIGWKDLEYPIDTDVLEDKNEFDTYCLGFLHKHLPDNFDQSRLQEVRVKVDVKPPAIFVKVTIKVDDKEFTEKSGSETVI